MEQYLEKEKQELVECAWAHYYLGMKEAEIDDCLRLIAIDANDPAGYLHLGSAYENQGRTKESRACYLELVRSFPNYSPGYVNLGYFFEKYEKRLDLAKVCYEKAVELDPACELALNNVATMFQKNGQWLKARQYFEQANLMVERREGFSCLVLHNLAWACYHCEDYNAALSLYEQLLHLCPEGYSDIHSIIADLGCVCYKMGRAEDAIRWFDNALSIAPSSRRCRRLFDLTNRKSDSRNKDN